VVLQAVLFASVEELGFGLKEEKAAAVAAVVVASAVGPV
jgi:hypothetical protein